MRLTTEKAFLMTWFFKVTVLEILGGSVTRKKNTHRFDLTHFTHRPSQHWIRIPFLVIPRP